MNSIFHNVSLMMTVGLFLFGVITFWTGIYLLVFRSVGRDVRTIADQSTQLAQKGLAEEIAGLVGNASSLLNAMNELVRTTTGIGVFLVFIGLALMGLAIQFVMRMQ
jgi:hypothetical protein